MTFIIGAGMVSAFYLIDSSDKDNAEVNTLVEAEFLLRKIDWVLTGMDSIVVPLPGDTIDGLSVNRGGTTEHIGLLNRVARIKHGSGSWIELTGERVKITDLKFTNIDNIAPKPDAIKAEFYADGKYFELLKYLRK